MAVIMIADAEVDDPEAYKEYLEKAPAFVAKHGGEYLARGGAFEVLRGDWKPTRLVIFRFPQPPGDRQLHERPGVPAAEGDPRRPRRRRGIC